MKLTLNRDFIENIGKPFKIGIALSNVISIISILNKPSEIISLNNVLFYKISINRLTDITRIDNVKNFLNTILNIPGIDIIAFESGDTPTDGANLPVSPGDPSNDEVENLAASLTGAPGSFVDFTVLDFLTEAQVGGSATAFGVYVLGLDLSDLGLAEGDHVSALVFGNSGSYLDHDPDIAWAGGVTGAAGPVIPLPPALPLMLGGLAMLGVLRRRAAARRA